MSSVQHDISLVPSHRTLVSAGHSHFSRVADALAEFIDNSIQATQRKQDARLIELGLDLNFNRGTESHLTILDNGEGMDFKTLSDFAVYSKDKELRGLAPSNENASNISKFGVGAKQAGFYLGTRIHVLTSAEGSRDILELIIDKAVIEARFSNNQDVFQGHITTHEAAAMSTTENSSSLHSVLVTEGKYNNRQQQVVNKLVDQKRQLLSSSFTLITVQLRAEITNKLRLNDDFERLPTQLADIYHFHLHPENLPNAVASRTKEK
jgi:structural maintenance of chromosomes flexible hinge domain-containing protein 1